MQRAAKQLLLLLLLPPGTPSTNATGVFE